MADKSAKLKVEHVLILKDDKGRKEYLLEKRRYSLGRAEECDIHVVSQFVSRYHATVFRVSQKDRDDICYRIVDGDLKGKVSVNGFLINGNKVSDHEFKHGDTIVFGPQTYGLYQVRQSTFFPTIPPNDPFDITLIDPAMMEEE